jgi:3-oxoacyl-[acyl-carrier-protein] synthase-3
MVIRARILGTGGYSPARVVTNDELARTLDTTDAWIRERTGIERRHVAAVGETTSGMAIEAARRALAAAECDPRSLDLVVLGTFTPDSPLPATAVHLQAALGARCLAFDVAAACSGFVVGLGIAQQFLENGSANRVLVVGAEMLSRVTDWSDRSTAVLFGDGAGAAVLGPSEDGRGILSTVLHSDGAGAPLLEIAAGGVREPLTARSVEQGRDKMKMDGALVFKHAVKGLAGASIEAMERAGIAAGEIDWVVPHQANRRILDGVTERLGIPAARVVTNLAEHGNTSSASIPLALDEAIRDGRIRSGHSVLLCAFGAGFTWGAAVVRM